MPLWNSGPTIVIRGCYVQDPEAEGYLEVEVGFDELFPRSVPFGERNERANFTIAGLKLRRDEIFLHTKPFYAQVAQGTKWQNAGDYRRLLSALTRRHVYIWRVWESGLDHTEGAYFPWADAGGTDTYWNLRTDTPAGRCPFPVELVGEPSVSELESGLFTVEVTLESKQIAYG